MPGLIFSHLCGPGWLLRETLLAAVRELWFDKEGVVGVVEEELRLCSRRCFCSFCEVSKRAVQVGAVQV